MANKVFSLHIDEYLTKIAHLNYRNNKIELLSLGFDATVNNYFTNPTEKSAATQSQVISRLYNQLNIRENAVQIVLPDSLTYSQLMVMPNLKDDDLAKSIRLQVEELIPLPINDVNIDFEVVDKLPDDRLLLIFIAVQKKIADHISHTLELAKLEPLSLENDLNVLGRFVTEVNPLVPEPSIICNLGFSSSSIYVINPKAAYFQYTKTVKIGFYNFIRDLKMNYNVDDKKTIQMLQNIGFSQNSSVNLVPVIDPLLEQISSEISRTISFMRDRYKINIKHIYLLNYDVYIAHIAERMQNRLSVVTNTLPVGQLFLPNPITQSFRHSLSSFVPVLAGHFR